MTFTRRAFIGAGVGTLIVGPAFAQTSPDDLRRLTHDPDQPVLGNPDGDVTVIEFYDYQCPYCRQSYPEIRDLVRQDGNLRLVMKDWPLFGEASERAVQIALGSGAHYEAVHDAMMAIENRRLDNDLLNDAAASVGVDPDKAIAHFASDMTRWDGLLTRNRAQARMLGLPGTPAFLIGVNLFPGVAPVAALRDAVAEVRGA